MSQRRVEFRIQSTGKEGVVADARAVGTAFKGAYDEAGAAAERAARKMDSRHAASLRAQLDPLGAAQSKYNREIERYLGLAERQRITQTELVAGQALAASRLERTRERLAGGAIVDMDGGPTRGQRAARLNLARQGADVFTMAGMGASPSMIAISQGPQILDGLAGAGIKATGSLVALGGAFTATAGAALLAYKAWDDGRTSALAYEQAATGMARASGLSAEELEKAAIAGAEAAGISERAARDMALTYASTGRVTSETLTGLIALTKDYASFTGTDAKEASEALAKAMAQPDKAAHELTLKYGLMDQETLKVVDSLVKQGDQMGAVAILMREMHADMDGHAKKAGEIASAWDAVAVSASNAWTALGKALYIDQSEKIERLQRLLEHMPAGPIRQARERELNALLFNQNVERGRQERERAEAATNSRDEARAQAAAAAAKNERRPRTPREKAPDRIREITGIQEYDPTKDWRNDKFTPEALDPIHQRGFRSSEMAAEALAKGFRDREIELRDSVHSAVSGGLKMAFGDPSAWQELQKRLEKAIMGTAASRITDFALARIGPAEGDRGNFIRDVLEDFSGSDGCRTRRQRPRISIADIMGDDHRPTRNAVRSQAVRDSQAAAAGPGKVEMHFHVRDSVMAPDDFLRGIDQSVLGKVEKRIASLGDFLRGLGGQREQPARNAIMGPALD